MSTNDITKIAAQKDAIFGFSGNVDAVSVGGSPKASKAAMEMLSGISNHSLDAAKIAAGALAAGALGGMVDATAAGAAVMMTTFASAITKGIGWKL